MQHHTPMVVRRGGAIRAFIVGLFGLLIAIVLCAAGVGLYALNMVDRKAETVLDLGGEVVGSLPEILPKLQGALPPALADALHDERRPEYRSNIAMVMRVTSRDERGRRWVVIEAENQGDQVVSVLAVRVVLVDADGTPVHSMSTYVATPLMVDDEWRGPLMPGSTRLCSVMAWNAVGDLTPSAEIVELRVWSGPIPSAVASAD